MEFCDVTLIGEDLIPVEAHRIVLSAFSRNLKGFVKQLDEGKFEIMMQGMDHEDIESLLQFMYLGEVSIAHAGVEKFLRTAKFLGISQLRDQCKVNIEDLNREFGVRLRERVDETTHDNNGEVTEDEDMEEQEYGFRINEDFVKGLNSKFGELRSDDESAESLGKDVWEAYRKDKERLVHENMESDVIDCEEENIRINEVLEVCSQVKEEDDFEEEDIHHRDTLQENDAVEDINNTELFSRDDNNSTQEDESYLDNVTVGKAEDNFNIHTSVFYSHNYFRKVVRDNGTKHAICIMCWKLSRTKVLRSAADNSTKSEFYFRRGNCILICLFSGLKTHLASKHTEFVDEYVLKRRHVDEMRLNEREKIKTASFKARKDIEFKKRKKQRVKQVQLEEQEKKTKKRKDFGADLFDSGLFATLRDGRNVRVGDRNTSEPDHLNTLFSYNYFEKISNSNGDKLARCLICASLKMNEKSQADINGILKMAKQYSYQYEGNIIT